jgi:uracil-DNA glycosylase
VADQPSLFSAKELDQVSPSHWTALKEEAEGCHKCDLHKSRIKVAFGEGKLDHPSVAFVGDSPGYEEDLVGRPFVGPQGKLLDRMIEAMKLQRKDLYLLHVVCCRPKGNQPPSQHEIFACHPYLVGQLQLVRPKIIVALGIAATQALTGKQEMLAKLRGHWMDWESIPLRVTYSLAYLLKVPEAKKDAWDDLLHVQVKIKELQDPA